jgi:hypothetical protein
MTRDTFVFLAVITMVGWYGFYLIGYEKGEDAARKSCPPQRGVVLKSIVEEGGVTRCLFASLPAPRPSVFARRAAS